MKTIPTVVAAFFVATSLGCSAVKAQTIRSEAVEHPRIATAIRELEEAIRYLEAAPHDFGGHKAAAIQGFAGSHCAVAGGLGLQSAPGSPLIYRAALP